MGIRSAVLFSVGIHGVLLLARPPEGFLPPRGALETIEISYLTLREPAGSRQPKEPAAPRGLPKPVPPAAPRSPSKPVPPDPVPPEPPLKPVVPALPAPAEPPLMKNLPGSSALNLSDQKFASLQHKEQVRSHLKRHLRYPDPPLQGRVRIRLLLNREGGLKELSILEATDPRLAESAFQGAKGSQPYPRFPAPLKGPQVRYDFLVRYEPELTD
ncbi:MAG: hypothetical protein HYZ90_02770 [Candidatus Omnitrophica bacterium]|nr:hypothetical protein [Candidatus Omnitrophota bacterium]